MIPLTSVPISIYSLTNECLPSIPTHLSHKYFFALDSSNLLVNTDTPTMRTSDIPLMPLFKHNATAAATGDIRADTPAFRTDLQLFSPGNHESSLIFYPFDVSVFLFVHKILQATETKKLHRRNICFRSGRYN